MKRNRLLISMAIIGCTLMTACGNSGSGYKTSDYAVSASEEASYADYDNYAVAEEAYEEDYAEPSNSADTQAEQVDESANAKRKLIRTVRLNAETYDFGALTASVTNKVTALGGYVENSNVYGEEKYSNRSASYTLRIPAANADEFIGIIEGKSNITSHSENVEDVTLSYVDIQSRKESLQIEYDRLQEMLGSAETVEDMIYIEDRLSSVRYEIQSIESQLRVYDNKIDYTTIYLEVSEVKEYTEPEPVDDSVGARIKRGLSNAGSNIVGFLQDLVVAIVVAIPYLILIAILIAIPVFLILFIVKACNKSSELKKKKRMAQAQMMAPLQPMVQTPPVTPAATPAANAEEKAEEKEEKAEEETKADASEGTETEE